MEAKHMLASPPHVSLLLLCWRCTYRLNITNLGQVREIAAKGGHASHGGHTVSRAQSHWPSACC